MAVLTNFIGNTLKSRLYWPRGGICEGPVQGGHRVTDRARRVVQGPSRRRTPPRARCTHPASDPPALQAGPLPLVAGRRVGSALQWLGTPPVYPPVIPTRLPTLYTHPVPPMPVHPADGCTSVNSHFWTLVGEPRGVRTQPVYRVPGWFIPLYEVYTAV